MILVEATFWPLVVVGAVPGERESDEIVAALEESELLSGRDVRLAVVIAGDRAHAAMAEEEVLTWLSRHRERLSRCASRVAWIVEDEPMRQSAERWLSLIGDRLFRGEVATFRSVRPAVSWLSSERAD